MMFLGIFIVTLLGSNICQSERVKRQTIDKNLMSIIEDCCGRGIDFAGLGRNCTDMASIPDVPYQNRDACKAVFMSCCDRQVSDQTCDLGIDHRLFEGSCVGLQDISPCTSSAEKECCDCCGLGITAYHQNIPCDRMNLQTSCDTAFTTCCRKAQRDNEGSTTLAPTASAEGGLCDNSPCEHGCRIFGQTYKCTCPSGYRLAFDRVSCEDIDECNTLADACVGNREICVNEQGTYRCSQYTPCIRGLRFNSVSGICDDVNECTENLHNCDVRSTCQNYYGYFRCSRSTCSPGFKLTQSGRCIDVDECGLGTYHCDIGKRCENYRGGYNCARIMSCGTGYTIHSITQECEDIDECFLRTHRCQISQRCINIEGSFECESCPDGYRVDTNNRCSLDIDECSERIDTCGANQYCQNTPGSFRCACPTGFTQDIFADDCTDIDECAVEEQPCGDHQLCINMQGQYRCQNMCALGLRYNPYTSFCEDIDECSEGTHRCDGNQECINQEGSYLCRCPQGYRVNQATRSCEDIDECMLSPTSCRGDCINTDGSYYCTCPDGYSLSANGYGCTDIDECVQGLHECDSRDECFNTLGDYKCRTIDCPEYFELRLRGNEVACDKVRNCPDDAPDCSKNVTNKISFAELALPSIPLLRSPLRLLTVRMDDGNRARYTTTHFRLVKGNDRGYFQVQRRYIGGAPTAYVMLVRPIYGPYETNLHLEINTYYSDRLRSQNIVIIHIDVGEYNF